jgi:pre-mRNA-splicing factor RBM22/SLT11
MDVAERNLANGQLPYASFQPTQVIQKLARNAPYYKRNRAHVCSFFVKGECKRGAECPYRHEMPETGELSVQNMKDRYYGVNDPVAKKMLGRADQWAKLTPPEDKDITTLYIGNLDAQRVSEEDLKGTFYSYGELRSIKVVPHQNCAFITYTTRTAAEAAAEALFNKCFVNGVFLRISWGKPASAQPSYATDNQDTYFSLPVAPPGIPSYAAQTPSFFFPTPAGAPPGMPPAAMPRPYYPSMDPSSFGAPVNPNPNPKP